MRSFWSWSIFAAGSAGCSIYAATEGHGANAEAIGALAVFGVLGAFRELAHEIADQLKAEAPDVTHRPKITPLSPTKS